MCRTQLIPLLILLLQIPDISIAEESKIYFFTSSDSVRNLINYDKNALTTGTKLQFKSEPKLSFQPSFGISYKKLIFADNKISFSYTGTVKKIDFEIASSEGVSLERGNTKINFVEPVVLNVSGNEISLGGVLNYTMLPNLDVEFALNGTAMLYKINSQLGSWQLADDVKGVRLEQSIFLSYGVRPLFKTSEVSPELFCGITKRDSEWMPACGIAINIK